MSHFANSVIVKLTRVAVLTAITQVTVTNAIASDTLPIADAHVHYSHDSVEMTPPQRVIELMRAANLKFALVSSSDDRGTQLLTELAPELIIPGLRPYRRRGELNTWYTDEKALAYTERLLKTNRYASIGEFHLYGDTADLPIPKRIVELAAQHNLVLHAHSDAEAVEKLLAQNSAVKVLWAHAGFDDPATISDMLSKHDRLWADLAFRSEVGSGGSLSPEWAALFHEHPQRLMLGTDTYTPERMYFVPEHAAGARTWLATLPEELAENIAWKNAYNLLMPIWKENNAAIQTETENQCTKALQDNGISINDSPITIVKAPERIEVSEPFTVQIQVCGNNLLDNTVTLNAIMPAHGHGMNYAPDHLIVDHTQNYLNVEVKGVLLHMPGTWQWLVEHRSPGNLTTSKYDFTL